MSDTVLPRRNLPTPRAEGMANMVQATVGLLHEMGPDQITVRAISERAGHHHRFVSEWFGGKAGLYRAALESMLADMTRDLAPFAPDGAGIPGDIRIVVQVINWLTIIAPEMLDGPADGFLRQRIVTPFVEDLGLDPEVADLLARRVVAWVFGVVLFGDIIGIDDEAFAELRRLEVRMALLLAQDLRDA
ncbi:TetR/AcrR family transcriptional regulator [Rhabdothermincola salaria]|uniref:TetR/AcrR family transcriptional regulator n=1 Tax=Rhabdothermincola salaria TaxID=2903142 RepID=UPI001E49B0DB|nr:hypothetical protein [Rhabdothermincola salaria]MCD9622798.1 hypothetical protein [Rhabdothermincola salaria]